MVERTTCTHMCRIHKSTPLQQKEGTYMTGAWLPAVLRRTIRLGSSTVDMPPLDIRCCMARRGDVWM